MHWFLINQVVALTQLPFRNPLLILTVCSIRWQVPGHEHHWRYSLSTFHSFLSIRNFLSGNLPWITTCLSHPIINFSWEVFIKVFISLINILLSIPFWKIFLWNCVVLVLDLFVDIHYWTLSRYIGVNYFYLSISSLSCGNLYSDIMLRRIQFTHPKYIKKQTCSSLRLCFLSSAK